MKERLRRRHQEKGSSDIVVVLLLLPIIVWLLLSLIDVGMYFQTRTLVQNVTRDAAREAAIWGGNNSPLNPTSQSVSAQAKTRLWDGNGCYGAPCKQAPNVSCTPGSASRAGETITCTVTFYPKTVAPGNPISAFSNMTDGSFVIKETARSETGF